MAETKPTTTKPAAETAKPQAEETKPEPTAASTAETAQPTQTAAAEMIGDDRMTLRDTFALVIAAGMLAGTPALVNRGSDMARLSYDLADSMLLHRTFS